MVFIRLSHSSLILELGTTCNSMAADVWFKCYEDHGGLWKTFTGLDPAGTREWSKKVKLLALGGYQGNIQGAVTSVTFSLSFS